MKTTRCLFIILSLVLQAQAEEGTKSLDEIFFAQRQNFMRVKSINMTYSDDWQAGEYTGNQPDLIIYPKRIVMKIYMEDDKFCIDDGVEGTKMHPKVENWTFEITAFDLNKYQSFNKKTAYLREQTKPINPLHCMNYPLTGAYVFMYNLRSHDDCTLEDFYSKELWEELKQRTQFIDDNAVEGYDCVVTEMSFPEKNRLARVYWAKEFQYYPVKHELFVNGKKVFDHTVKQLSKYDTAEGLVVIPISSIHTEWHPVDGYKRFAITQTIDKDSLTINEDIPDDIFTIPLYKAMTYENFDDPSKSYSLHRVIDESIEKLNSSNPESSAAKQDILNNKIENKDIPSTPTQPTETPQEIDHASSRENSFIKKYLYFVSLVLILVIAALLYKHYQHKGQKGR